MTVLRLRDGSLWVHNPLAPTGELLEQLASIGGRVAHVVVPNNSPEHWVYAGDFCDALADDVQLWVPPGFLTDRPLPFPWLFGLKELRDRIAWREFGEEAPEEWGGEVEVALFRTPTLVEAAFLLRSPRALLLADAAFKMDASCGVPAGNVWQARLLGVWQRLGCPTRVVFSAFPKRARAFVQRLLQFDFDTVVPAHFLAPVPGGKQALLECFKFLL
ncbi:hypothetical protein WJX81_006657 [Elliptochloris bilobata]|uniref:MBL fold metallo-hydrolase n=1 Tax=Elliptochloris bilobata TaxID=381761 RepID=A0AAW1RZ07_9CHLO